MSGKRPALKTFDSHPKAVQCAIAQLGVSFMLDRAIL